MASNEAREITNQKIRPPATDPNLSRGISITNQFSKVLIILIPPSVAHRRLY